ncbi:MAG: hypothetical protein O7E57_03850 [Gammaproteobacteria bacterium]|nr:hypothetical protein [Gammaproteobacteria bacterium]
MWQRLCSTLLAVVVYAATAAAAEQNLSAPSPPPGEKSTRVIVEVKVNKIFAISEVDETYLLDGYLTARWMDSRNPKPSIDSKLAHLDYLDDNAESVLGSSIWWPYIEFINVTGKREVQNRRLRL